MVCFSSFHPAIHPFYCPGAQSFYQAADQILQLDPPLPWELAQLDVIDKLIHIHKDLLLLPKSSIWPISSINCGLTMCIWGAAQVLQCLNLFGPWRRNLSGVSNLSGTQGGSARAHPAVSPRRSSLSIPAATVEPSFCPAPWRGTAWCLRKPNLVFFSPKGLQFSSSLHIPHIFTHVKGKQLCGIFSFTSWKEKQRKLKSEALFCTIERINDAFPTSSTFPPKLTC